MAASVASPSPPRLAATMVLVRDDPFEVLMVKRSARGAFASALVFPGGVVESQDHDAEWLAHADGAESLTPEERALRIAGIRESFEETGLLLAEGGAGPCVPVAERASRPFLDFIRERGLRLRLDDVVPFAHWVTPHDAPKRYDTHFYLAAAPSGGETICDGVETVALEWDAPATFLGRGRHGDGALPFPTWMNLGRLAESGDSASALAAARARPHFAVHPRSEMRPEGMTIVIPPEAGYAVSEGLAANRP